MRCGVGCVGDHLRTNARRNALIAMVKTKMLWQELYKIQHFSLLALGCLSFAVYAERGPSAKLGKIDTSVSQFVDGTVATVRGLPILYSEIDKKVVRGPLITVSSYPASEEDTPYQKALQDAINYALIEDHARFLEIEITDKDVQDQVDQVMTRNGLDLEQLKKALEQQGETYEGFRSDLHRQILMSRFQGRVLLPLIRVTESDLKEYYYSLKKGGSADAALLDLNQISINLPASSSASSLVEQGRMEEVRKLVQDMRKGLSVQDALKLYPGQSESVSLEIPLRDLSDVIKKSVQGVGVGGITDPLQMDKKIVFFIVKDRKFEPGEDYQSQKAELKQKLRIMRMQEELEKWIVKARKEPGLNILTLKDPIRNGK